MIEKSGHDFELVFESEEGDFSRCSCGARGYDFKQGAEWREAHLREVDIGDARDQSSG